MWLKSVLSTEGCWNGIRNTKNLCCELIILRIQVITLLIRSDKTIKWDDVIKADFYLGTSNKLSVNGIFWQIKKSVIKIAHREEEHD